MFSTCICHTHTYLQVKLLSFRLVPRVQIALLVLGVEERQALLGGQASQEKKEMTHDNRGNKGLGCP